MVPEPRRSASCNGSGSSAEEKEIDKPVPKKYTRAEGPERIRQFLDQIIVLARFQLTCTVGEEENLHPDFENPNDVVRFAGEDVDLLLANKADFLLSLEQ